MFSRFTRSKLTISFLSILTILTSQAFAQDRTPRGEAHWMLERLTGVKYPATSPLITQMAEKIAAGDKLGAAEIATSQPAFLNVNVKQMALQMSTRDETIREPFNDFAAAFMGVARDRSDARELLYGNFYYAATDASRIPAGVTIRSDLVADLLRSNNHYVDLENNNVDIGAALVRVNGQQILNSNTTSIPNPDPAGVLTSRAFLGAHALAGTNRRLVEYTFRQFMCVSIQEWADGQASDLRIGRDVDRFPGGDHEKFLSTCKTCHTVMDGFRGAFAKWDFVENVGAVHADNGATNGNLRPNTDQRGVMAKMNRNDFVQYPGGYISTDDSFVNNANRGANATRFGWRGMAPDTSDLASRTTGVHAFGRLVANSQRFSQCMAKRVWNQVCRIELSPTEMETVLVSLGLQFEMQKYDLRELFEIVATHPKCRI